MEHLLLGEIEEEEVPSTPVPAKGPLVRRHFVVEGIDPFARDEGVVIPAGDEDREAISSSLPPDQRAGSSAGRVHVVDAPIILRASIRCSG